ncbi:MAG: DUF2484 family protein [Rhodobacteraceae bacterium]|nr:DUF2484 family protein [Paracoccaceae bacterium]
MSLSIVVAALWVLAATAVAMLPMRRQYGPGLALLLLAPVLIGWLWIDQGWVVGCAALAGFVSMFRHPLRYFWRKWRGGVEREPVPGGESEEEPR